MNAEDVLSFWFYEVGRDRWFTEDRALDLKLRELFLKVYEKAEKGELEAWKSNPEGTLALLLLLGEFPHRMFRGTQRAFATHDQALELAREGVIKHFDDRIDKQFKLFFYLPFLNSESIGDQRLAVFYIRERTKETEWLDRAQEYYNTIQRFGRFPERSSALGRELTPEEVDFLKLNTRGNA